jgi:hypothetical protein
MEQTPPISRILAGERYYRVAESRGEFAVESFMRVRGVKVFPGNEFRRMPQGCQHEVLDFADTRQHGDIVVAFFDKSGGSKIGGYHAKCPS